MTPKNIGYGGSSRKKPTKKVKKKTKKRGK